MTVQRTRRWLVLTSALIRCRTLAPPLAPGRTPVGTEHVTGRPRAPNGPRLATSCGAALPFAASVRPRCVRQRPRMVQRKKNPRPPAGITYEPVGGGWCRVAGGTDAVYWWHEAMCKRLWVEPTSEQISAGERFLKRKGPKARAPKMFAAVDSQEHGGRSADAGRSLLKLKLDQGATGSDPRPVVPLELPELSPKRSPRMITMARVAKALILPDAQVKPRVKHGPVPRQQRVRAQGPAAKKAAAAAEELRKQRLERQRAEELATYAAAFQIIDMDGSGAVEPPEVLKVLKLLGKKVDDKRFWEVFRELDLDNSSSLELDEFQIVMDTLARKKLPNAGMQVSDRASRCNHSPLPPFCC